MNAPAQNEQKWLRCMSSGRKSFEGRKLDKALNSFRKAVRILPQRKEGWVNLGSTLLEAKRYQEAARALERAISIDNRLMLAHLLLGDCLRMSGKRPEASACYRNALALQRSPLSLNRMACALREDKKLDLAEGLYREALSMDSGFTLARVNLATLEVERCNTDRAREHLNALAGAMLAPAEQQEVDSANWALTEFQRLDTPINTLVQEGDSSLLEHALRASPAMGVDQELLAAIQRYARSARRLSHGEAISGGVVLDDWPEIEAAFLIPLVSEFEEYRLLRSHREAGRLPGEDRQKLEQWVQTITTARACRDDMLDPLKAELQLRYWHALACKDSSELQPGHFKYVVNWIPTNPNQRRVSPAQASGTFRHFIEAIYGKLEPGYGRAATVYMALVDLHLFSDGNGRIARNWLNRELEWAGLVPCLFRKGQKTSDGFKQAIFAVRGAGGDLSPLIEFIKACQREALACCEALRQDSGPQSR